jgi:hypothetical protein
VRPGAWLSGSDWKPAHLSEPTALLELPSIGFQMTLADVYEDVPDAGGGAPVAAST